MATSNWERASAAAAVLRRPWQYQPRIAIVLGSGLGDLPADFEADGSLAYEEIPYFPAATALGHTGRLSFGLLHGQPTYLFQGRWHRYEGLTAQQIAVPIQACGLLGVRWLITTCSAGGLNSHFRAGDVVTIDDHINLTGASPLAGPHESGLGPRFPDLSQPYDSKLRTDMHRLARAADILLQTGVYAGVIGPNYETAAEYRMLRRIGADLVGMSTVPETIAATAMGIRVLALAIVTNVCHPDLLGTTSGSEVLQVAQHSAQTVRRLIWDLVGNYDQLELD